MPRDLVTYEWHVECADEHGDINNVDFADTLTEALDLQRSWAKCGEFAAVNVALVRTEGNQEDGIGWRGYAYLRDGTLEPTFSTYHDPDEGPADDGPDVPQRFHKEAAACRPFAEAA